MTLLFSIRVGDARTLAPRTTQQLAGSSEMDSHLCHVAVNKPTAMDIQPSVDVSLHRRIPERNFSLKYIYLHRNLSNPQTQQKIKCTNINMQYNVHHFSSESLVQSSVTYNRDKKQCTRTTILCMRLVEASSLHAAR